MSQNATFCSHSVHILFTICSQSVHNLFTICFLETYIGRGSILKLFYKFTVYKILIRVGSICKDDLALVLGLSPFPSPHRAFSLSPQIYGVSLSLYVVSSMMSIPVCNMPRMESYLFSPFDSRLYYAPPLPSSKFPFVGFPYYHLTFIL